MSRDAPFLDREIASLQRIHQLVREVQRAHSSLLRSHPSLADKLTARTHWLQIREELLTRLSDHGDLYESPLPAPLGLVLSEHAYALSDATEIEAQTASKAIAEHDVHVEELRADVVARLKALRSGAS
ncbi:MAG: hypothetical protein AB7K71_10695 [Polyangiaceae bacterium]